MNFAYDLHKVRRSLVTSRGSPYQSSCHEEFRKFNELYNHFTSKSSRTPQTSRSKYHSKVHCEYDDHRSRVKLTVPTSHVSLYTSLIKGETVE